VLGDFLKVDHEGKTDHFTKYFEKQIAKSGTEKFDAGKSSQVTIIDMSLLSFEVLETITGLIGRLILEFQSRFKANERGLMPVAIILEEAQNYIPEHDRKDKTSISKKVFERIAREGRKYGLSLIVSSQRPFELSKTVLSQCNSFIVHRLQNPDDQKYVRQLVSAANEDILQQLPILPQQNAIIMGDCVRTPVQMRVNNARPSPNSANPKFIENWLKSIDNHFPDYKNISKAWEEGKSIDDYLAHQQSNVENELRR
jgi:DNA helicase HerA-like ATPase